MKHEYLFGKILLDIRERIKTALSLNPIDSSIPMSSPTFGVDEITEALESLLRLEVTMGKKCAAFERQFADYIGSKHAIMVNSGSSANLLMMSALTNPDDGRLKPGDEVIVPALTWGTGLWPVIQTGCIPVLVDSKLETLCIDVDEVKKNITSKTKAVFVAHILGNSADMEPLEALCKKHGLVLIEDACESLGTTYKGKKVGTIGEMGSYSFYFSHHITTIEGGMVVTDDDKTADLLKTLRAHGWTRHLKDKSVEKDYPDIDPRFMFCNLGYSIRPTEIQGSFGIHQLRKLDGFNEDRKDVAFTLRAALSHLDLIFTEPTEGTDHTWFGFPIILKDDCRKELCDYLYGRGIETRPIIAGNLAKHPALEKFEHRTGDLPVAQLVMERGFYIGSQPDMTIDQILRITKAMDDFLCER